MNTLIARREWLSSITRCVLKLGQWSGVTQHHDMAVNSAVEVTASNCLSLNTRASW